jgi:hypothetical protein
VRQVRRDREGVAGGTQPSSAGVSRAGEIGASNEAASRLLAPELDPANESGPEELGRFLAEAGKLPAETRAGLAGLIVREHRRPLRALVDASCPPGSVRRMRLATALAAHTGAPSNGLPPSVVEDVVAQTLASLGATGAPGGAATGGSAAAGTNARMRRAGSAAQSDTEHRGGLPAAQRVEAPADTVVRAPAAIVAWADKTDAILRPRLRAAAEALGRLERKVALGRALLATVAARRFPARKAVARAAALLEAAQFAAGVARELAPTDAAAASAVVRAIAARGELARVRSALLLLNEVLGRLARRAAAVRPTPGEIGDIDRAALEVAESLSALQALAALLLELQQKDDAGALTEGDLRAVGLAFEPTVPPPQIFWVAEAVRVVAERRGERGERGADRRSEPGRRPAGVSTALRAADLLAVLKAKGVDLTQIDPGQLAPAARYVNDGDDSPERGERLLQTVDAFRVLATLALPLWSRNRMADLLRTVARLPGRVLHGLPDAEIRDRFQEIARAVNLGSGVLRTKVGTYHVVLVVDDEGRVLRCSCRKRGVVSRVGGAIGRTGGPLGPLAAGPFAAGESLRRTGLLGLARLGAALLGPSEGFTLGMRQAAPAADHRPGERLPALFVRRSLELEADAANAAAFKAYRKAGPLLAEARRELTAALASSDPAAIARAQKRLRQAEDEKAAALRRAAADILGSRPPAPSLPASAGPVRPPREAPPSAPRSTATLATSAVLKSLARELKQTQAIIERGRQAAKDLYQIAKSADMPEKIRVVAAAAAFSMEEATRTFKHEIAEAASEDATEAARLVFERRLTAILDDHRQIHLALAALYARDARALFRASGTLPPERV